MKGEKLSLTELEQYLHKHIPLSKAMGVAVVSADVEAVVLQAPLAPNINHRETVFGGSASALAILAAWSLLHTRLRRKGIEARLVIQRNTMEYGKPIFGEFTARASLEQEDDWLKFTRMLERKGKARVTVLSELEYAGQVVGMLSGEFVALRT
ncbi:YiiD C-terminal domain-containing protein [Methylomonas sp. MgM2]